MPIPHHFRRRQRGTEFVLAPGRHRSGGSGVIRHGDDEELDQEFWEGTRECFVAHYCREVPACGTASYSEFVLIQ